MARITIVKIPPNVKEQTLKDIARFMGDKPYKMVEYTPSYGWNGLIPVTTHKSENNDK